MRKSTPVRELPPRLELDCLKSLWALGEGSVKQVRDLLAIERELAYTTVMTVLDRLARRGGVRRRKVGRSFVYVPVMTQEAVRRLAVQELLDCYFDGSADELRLYLGQGGGEELTMAAAAGDSPELQLDASLL
jgi:predicted transcriptional regulator